MTGGSGGGENGRVLAVGAGRFGAFRSVPGQQLTAELPAECWSRTMEFSSLAGTSSDVLRRVDI